MAIPLKPRGSVAREGLKQLKDLFDDLSLSTHEEEIIAWAALHGPSRAFKAYGGEFLHQLALRKSELRGDVRRARWLYEMSCRILEGNPLGLARVLRDYGLFLAWYDDDPSEGLEVIQQALRLHDDDLNNEKGHRHRLITLSALWRVEIMSDSEQSQDSLNRLVELALGPDFTFYVKDRKAIIDFLIPRTQGSIRRQLLAQKAVIHAERQQPKHVVASYARLIIDIEVSAIKAIRRPIRRIFERSNDNTPS